MSEVKIQSPNPCHSVLKYHYPVKGTANVGQGPKDTN